MRKFSISDKLILASLLLSIITITIVASYSFINARSAILERTFNQLTSVRLVKTALIENFFLNSVRKVELAAASTDVKNIIEQINKFEATQAYSLLDENQINTSNSFIEHISQEQYYKVMLIGKNRKILKLKRSIATNLVSNRNYDSLWTQAISTDMPVISDLTRLDSLSQPMLTISSKVIDENNTNLGIIVFEIAQYAIDSIMLEDNPDNGLGNSGESYLVGEDYLMRSSSRFQENSVLSTLVNTRAVEQAFHGISSTEIINDYRGVEVLSSFGKINIPNLYWIILTEIDYKESTVPVYRTGSEIVFISIFIFILVLVVVIVLSRRITLPIQRLNHAAHQIGSGNLDVEISHKLNDEIGDLTDTFNLMIHKLKDQTEELEAERIKSLRSQIDGQEAERQRLSRELHDSLGQLLIGLKLKYESCLNKSQTDDFNIENFSDLEILFDQTIEETRRISNNLMPAALSEFGIIPAIRNICNEISETTDINILFKIEGNSSEMNVLERIYIFRITQEALTNILKHSQAKNATVNLRFEPKLILLTIHDDGKGFEKSKLDLTNKNGLNNMNDRVSLLSGNLNIATGISQGSTIHIEIPINSSK